MSFVRVRRTHSATGVPRKKRPIKRRPVWDDTVNDLTALRATPEEIEYRKKSHQSKNALAMRLQTQKELQKRKKKAADLSISNAEARQLAIMKEVLYDQQQFQNTIAKSDKMLASVKDMFGDDPKRFAGFPNVTSAPNNDDTERNTSIVSDHPDIKTRMEALSQSLMDDTALNDFDTDSGDEAVAPDPITYQPRMNMERFQQYLVTEEKNQSLSTISGQAQLSQLAQGPVQSTQIQDTASLHTSVGAGYETPKKNPNESVSILKTPRSAINDTKKIKKTRKRMAPPQIPQQNTSSFNLTDLRKVLEDLQDEIAEFEKQTGRCPPAEKQRQETFSGYTLSLVDSVKKLSRYLKENDLRLRAETTVREQLMQDVSQLAALIDALTSDIIVTQEESAKLKQEFAKYKLETQSEIQHLKSVLQKAGLMGSEETVVRTPPKEKSALRSSVTDTDDEDVEPSKLRGLPDHLQTTSAAVLLSPPVRKSRLQREEESSETQPVPQMVLTNLPNYNNGNSNPSMASSVDSQGRPPLHGSASAPSLHQTMGTFITKPTALYENMQGSESSTHTQSDSTSSQGTAWYPQSQFLQSMPPPQKPSQSLTGSQQHPVPFSTIQGYSQTHPSASYPGHMAPGTQGKPAPINNAARVTVPRPSPLVQSNVGVSLQSDVRPIGPNPENPTTYFGTSQSSTYGSSGMGMSQSGQGINQGHLVVPPVSYVGSQTQDQSNLPHSNGLPAPPSYNSKDVLAAQIAELNKQHEEAQIRLQVLMQQQQNQHLDHLDQHHTLEETDKELRAAMVLGQRRPQQQGLPSYPVSPPISPISQKSDKFLSLQGLAQQNNSGPSSREITVSIPSMSLETSNESSPSPKRA